MKKAQKKEKKRGKKTILGNDSSKQKSERGRMVFLEKKTKRERDFQQKVIFSKMKFLSPEKKNSEIKGFQNIFQENFFFSKQKIFLKTLISEIFFS